MKILITGGAGFLGARLAREILKRGQLNGQSVSELVIADLFPAPADLLADATLMRLLRWGLPLLGLAAGLGAELWASPRAIDVLSPALLGSFALLGIAPWLAKLVIAAVQRRKVYAGFSKPKTFDRNLVVIGAGSAGLVSALIAATVKAKVTLVEANEMGGDCLNTGCVPSKALIKSAKLAHQMRHGSNYGLSDTTPTFSFKAVMQRIHDVIAAIEPHDSVERYTGLGVEVLQGYAKLVNPWTVEVALNGGGTQRLTARSIVIAAGARPFVPPLPGLDDVGYVTSDTMWDAFAKLEEVPKRLVVLGGGPIGCELAQAFARLGAQVILDALAARGGEFRQPALAEGELEGAAACDLHGVLERLRQVVDRSGWQHALQFSKPLRRRRDREP